MAQSSACLTQAEAQSLIVYTSPLLITAIAKLCVPHLAPTAAFAQSAPIIAARYKADADLAWGDAARAFDKVTPVPMSQTLGERGVRALIDPIIATTLAKRIKTADCIDIDQAIDALQPLPPRNVARLILILLERRPIAGVVSFPYPLCTGRR